MGHVPESDDMLDLYRQGFFDDRLRHVVDCVHGWLYAKPAKGTAASGKAKAKAGNAKQPRTIKVEPRRRKATAEAADEPSLKVFVG
jgi:hypothetical protein